MPAPSSSIPTDRSWVAGILEGEGSFCLYRHAGSGTRIPVVQVQMTDRDIIERVAAIIGGRCYGPTIRPNRKPMWTARITGKRAADLMESVFVIMGERRQGQIAAALSAFDAMRPHQRDRIACKERPCALAVHSHEGRTTRHESAMRRVSSG